MHGIGFAVDYKVADRQTASLLFRTIINYYVLYFLLYYNIKSLFVNAKPIQERRETLPIFGYSYTTKNLPAKPTGFICTLIEGSLFFGATLPQQLLHLSKLIRGNVLPLQQCGKEAHDLRFVGMGINRGSKILFSC